MAATDEQRAGAGAAATSSTLHLGVPAAPAAESRLPSSPSSRSSTPLHPHRKENAPKQLLNKLKSITRKSKATPGARRPSCRIPGRALDEGREFGPAPAPTPTRPSIKVRLVTFNMHDSLPGTGGDLSDFLGEIRGALRGRNSSTSTAGGFSTAGSTRGSTTGSIISIPSPAHLPLFPLTTGHPYHLVVVAGQECPKASGVLSGRVRTLDGRGWTSMLEDWLCGGVHSDEVSEAPEESVAEDESDAPKDGGPGEGASLRSLGTVEDVEDDEDDEESGRGSHRGPYVLVEKARLMGIFLSIFVHRSCDQLVDGTSTGRVTAGLIGGRVGNKGGVGISLSFAGSRLLFVSAHLAAHAHHVDIRKANVAKILGEMEIDDFLGEGSKSGDLTSRFDQTFFLGDLNFRLDVTRLHADWLLKSRDYATALEFDQLRQVLAEPDSVFKGFSEAPITFAPTYKYDIVYKVRKRRSTLLRGHRERAPKRTSRDWKAFQPVDVDELDTGAASDPEMLQATRDFPPEEDDVRSLLSDASALSDYERVEKTPDLAAVAMGLPSSPPKGNATSMDAVRKAAQVRFLTLVRTNSAAAAFVKAAKQSTGSSTEGSTSGSGNASPRKLSFPAVPFVRPMLRGAHSEVVLPLDRATGEDSSAAPSEDEAATPETETESPILKERAVAACFDSSSKQRVQSYTDRILFMSTVPIPDDPPTLPQYTRRGSTFVDSIKNLVQGFSNPTPPEQSHAAQSGYFDRSVADLNNSDRIRQWRTTGSEGPGNDPQQHGGLFGNLFSRENRRGLKSHSVDSLVSPETSPIVEKDAGTKLKRSKSLQAARTARRTSLAPSLKSMASHDKSSLPFWKRRRSSTTGLGLSTTPTTLDMAATPNGLPSSPLANSPILATPTLPPVTLPPPVVDGDATVTKRARKRPTFSVRSSSSSQHNMSRSNSLSALSPAALPPITTAPPAISSSYSPDEGHNPTSTLSHGLPRSLTRASLNRSSSGPNLGHGHSLSLHRLKSFFHLPSLPFLSNDSTPDDDGRLIVSPGELEPPARPLIAGPRKGEIQVLQYDAVTDLAKMDAISDHRPVFAVVAVGVGGDPVLVSQ